MIIETICVTPFQQNARLIIDELSNEACVIDPGGDLPLILARISEKSARVSSVILTHSHIDHVGACAELLRVLESELASKPKLIGHMLEKDFRESVSEQAVFFGLSPEAYLNCPEPDEYVEQGSEITIGACVGRVMFVPGHSPGHVAIFFDGEGDSNSSKKPVLIAGDTLFAGSIGRTDLPGGDYDTLIRSIKEEILTLPANTVVKPGHGPDTTVETEKRTNPFLA